MIVHWFGNVATLTVPEPEFKPLVEEAIAKSLKVPYWIIGDRPTPRWRERPIWRLRAAWWRRANG